HPIAGTNGAGGPSWWGRTPDAVLRHAAELGASHAIVYTDSGDALPSAWAQRGYAVCSTLDWAACRGELRGDALWRRARPPCWWLLSVPRDSARSFDGEQRSAA